MKHIKLFEQHSEYETYINSSDKILPNISYCRNQNDIHYHSAPTDANIIFTGNNAELSVTSVKLGRPAALQIEIPKEYYADNISIIMGSNDITSTAWNESLEQVIIDNVTDDLTISISASLVSGNNTSNRIYFDPVTMMEGHQSKLKFYVNTTNDTYVQNVLAYLNFPNYITLDNCVQVYNFQEANFGKQNDYIYTICQNGFPSINTIIGYCILSLNSTVQPGKYLNAIEFQSGEFLASGSTIRFNGGDTILNILPYERKILNETDTEYVSDEYDFISRDITLNKAINANEWTFITLPFDLTESQLKAAFGNDVQFAQFDAYDFGNSDELELYFESNEITSGLSKNEPYLIKTSTNIQSVNIDNVVLDADEDFDFIEYDDGRVGSRRIVYATNYGYLKKQPIIVSEGDHYITLSNKQFSVITNPESTFINAYSCYLSFNGNYLDIQDITDIILYIDDDQVEGYSWNNN